MLNQPFGMNLKKKESLESTNEASTYIILKTLGWWYSFDSKCYLNLLSINFFPFFILFFFFFGLTEPKSVYAACKQKDLN